MGEYFLKQHVEPQEPQNLKKILRKYQASDAWATTFKNTDLSKSSLKVKKLGVF